MIASIRPAVCGSRTRTVVALASFSLAALVAAGTLGLALGLAGQSLGLDRALPLVAVLALAAALRELGLVPVAIPQRRWQVPERWRRELPAPLWAAGFGACLGLGVLTYLPVATLPVLLVAAVAVPPAAAVAALASFGAGRGLAAALPAHAPALLARGVGPMRIANAVVLIAIAAVTLPGARAQAAPTTLQLGPGSQYDPAANDRLLAFTRRLADGSLSVAVFRDGRQVIAFPRSATPALSGSRLAFAAPGGLRVVDLTTGKQLVQLPGRWRKPALYWPWLVALDLRSRTLTRVVAFDLVHHTHRELARRPGSMDVGRPSVGAHGVVVWHEATNRVNDLVRTSVRSGRARAFLSIEFNLVQSPSLHGSRLIYVRERGTQATLVLASLAHPARGRSLYSVHNGYLLWTTALTERYAYVTRWKVDTGVARIVRIPI